MRIQLAWTDRDFYKFVRDLCPFALVDAKVVPSQSEFQNAGQGRVTCYNFAEAETCKNILHMRPSGGEKLLTVEYSEPIKKAHRDTYEGKTHKQIFGIKEVDPAVKRYNMLVNRCGAYWKDAEAILERMRSEGHLPNLYTYIGLLYCYRNARPPQPQKAMLLLERMRSEGIPLSTTACNLAVDAWCRAGLNAPDVHTLLFALPCLRL